jgi:hypothetical protein
MAILERRVADEIFFPGGYYFQRTPVFDWGRMGLSLRGAGIEMWRPQDRRARTAATFIMLGEEPNFLLEGFGHTIGGFNLWKGFKGPVSPSTWKQSAGLHISRSDVGPPSGKHNFGPLGIAGHDKAISFSARTHADSCNFYGAILTDSCRTAVYCDNQQTTCAEFSYIQLEGPGENLFEIKEGGNFQVQTVAMVEPRLLYKIYLSNNNTCTYIINNLKVDNNCQDKWRIVEMKVGSPIDLYIRGRIGTDANPAPNPIALKKPPEYAIGKPFYHHLQLDLIQNGDRPLWLDWSY